MPLALPAILALFNTCAPTIAPGTMLPLVRVESGLDPLAIGVNGPDRRQLHPTTLADAATKAKRLIAQGQNIDLGLAQINSANLGRLRLSLDRAFDPCANLSAASSLLQAAYAATVKQPGGPRLAVLKALSIYNTGRPDRGFRNGYVAKVTAAAGVTLPSLQPLPSSPPMAPSPVWDVFPARPAAAPFVFTPHDLGDRP